MLADLCYLLLLVVLSPFFLYKMVTQGKYREGLAQRLGRIAPREGEAPLIWLHAVSVGEVLASRTLVAALARELPDHAWVISTTTRTGQRVAKQQFPDRRVVYFPLDFSWVVRKYFRALRPVLVILMELEVWPNFLKRAAREKVPVAVVNGRISGRSFRGYRRLRGFASRMFGRIGFLGMQNEEYAGRVEALGVPPERVAVTGNLKYDTAPTPDEAVRLAYREKFRIDPREILFVAASTHDGEEEPIFNVFSAVRTAYPALRLLLVPRHPERAPRVRLLGENLGLPCRLLSQVTATGNATPLSPGETVVVDTVGELVNLYQAGDVVFVGGSLVATGGHNILEPAALGKLVCFGLYMENFREEEKLLLSVGGGMSLSGPDMLQELLLQYCARPEAFARYMERAKQAVSARRGATENNVSRLRKLLTVAPKRVL